MNDTLDAYKLSPSSIGEDKVSMINNYGWLILPKVVSSTYKHTNFWIKYYWSRYGW